MTGVEQPQTHNISSDEEDLFLDRYKDVVDAGGDLMQDPNDAILLQNRRTTTQDDSKIDLNDPREYGLYDDETHYPVRR